MAESNEKCIICGNNVSVKMSQSQSVFFGDYECSSCGVYPMLSPQIRPFNIKEDTKYILAGVLRETRNTRGEITLTEETIEGLINSASIPNGPLESIDRILQYVFKKSDTAASYIHIAYDDYPIAYAKDRNECKYFLEMAVELHYLETKQGSGINSSTPFRLTLKGWERVDELRKKVVDSKRAFVAMWFDEELGEAWSAGIKPALEETGYIPLRLDLVEHNEKIDDKIIAEIRKSGLLIADFTGHRGGVYFEAGFAMGLGIPVVWTCREDHLKDAHFDTRQYNHIAWKEPADLKEKLKNRIEASIGIKR
jgi:nucleoside 2-deoxyribosyltransferase